MDYREPDIRKKVLNSVKNHEYGYVAYRSTPKGYEYKSFNNGKRVAYYEENGWETEDLELLRELRAYFNGRSLENEERD